MVFTLAMTSANCVLAASSCSFASRNAMRFGSTVTTIS